MYYKENLIVKRLRELEPPDSEILCLDLLLPDTTNKHVLLVTCYRPDDRNIVDFTSDLHDISDYSLRMKYHNCIFLGDFNAKHSEWFSEDVTNTEGSILKYFIDSVNLKQLVDFPTRFRNNQISCLDLIICDKDGLISNVRNASPIGKSDHTPIPFDLTGNYPKPPKITRNIWNLAAGDFDQLNRILVNTDWDSLLNTNDVNLATDIWYNFFTDLASQYIPSKTIHTNSNDKLPYMTKYLKKLIATRYRYFKKYCNSGSVEDHDIYKIHRNKFVSESRLAESKYYEKLSDDLLINQSNSKAWWNLVKESTKYSKASSSHCTPLDNGGIFVYDSKEKANIFNRFFTETVQTENPSDPIPSNHNLIYYKKIPGLIIDEIQVYKLLENLDPKKATGSDNISNAILKRCSIGLAKPLCIIFNKSIQTGVFPTRWKLANVSPIFKQKGDIKKCNFYRPISLLCCTSKILEKLMFSHIYEFLRKNRIIVPNQVSPLVTLLSCN